MLVHKQYLPIEPHVVYMCWTYVYTYMDNYIGKGKVTLYQAKGLEGE
jgi:hypothetical protein